MFFALRQLRACGLQTLLLRGWLGLPCACRSIISIGAQNLYVLKQAVRGQHVRACVAWCVGL